MCYIPSLPYPTQAVGEIKYNHIYKSKSYFQLGRFFTRYFPHLYFHIMSLCTIDKKYVKEDNGKEQLLNVSMTMKEFKKEENIFMISAYLYNSLIFPLVSVRRIMKLFIVCILEFVIGKEFPMICYDLYLSS